MKLQDIRKRAGLSQSELSRSSGVNLRTIQEYENGRRKIDSAHIDTLLNISNVLSVPFYELMEDTQRIEKIKDNIKREA
jgi:transcriptional regulator with XRE-family HTH domain